MYKGKIALDIVLAVWQLPQIILGLIFLAIFRNAEPYTNPHNGITVWRISSGTAFGTASFSTGPIIVTCQGVTEQTLLHETGHSKQSVYFGPIYHILVSIPSICRFWYRRLAKKDMDWYYSGWPERQANRLGGADIR